MFEFFRWIKRQDALARELNSAHLRIADLENKLAKANSGPSFGMVAKDFDASNLHASVRDQVIKNLTPILEEQALDFLKKVMRDLRPDFSDEPVMRGLVADDYATRLRHFEFRVPEMGCKVLGPVEINERY